MTTAIERFPAGTVSPAPWPCAVPGARDMARKSLVIVGGGYVGIELAKALDEIMDVTLVEPRSAFVHAPAMLRAVVQPKLLDRALIPYDNLLKRGRVISDRATALGPHYVDIGGGERIDADFTVVATGSSNGVAFKPAGDDIDGFRDAHKRMHAAITRAPSIAIVGAGAVGTELAGEIAQAMPGKAVTLICDSATLFPSMPPALGRRLAQKLDAMGVKVRFGVRADALESTTEHYLGPLSLSDGECIEADLVIPAIGARPNTGLFDGLPGVQRGSAGRVKVDPFLRPSDYDTLFAAGDAADAGDAATIVAISRQQPWHAKALKALAAGKSLHELKPYAPWGKAPILVPLGPTRGNSFLMVATFGDWVTKNMKGHDLFIPKYRKILGQPA